MAEENGMRDEPCFVISVAARMVGLHAQTLRYYERVGLVMPSRSGGRQRLYSLADVERLRQIKTFTDEMGVNLAGAEIALKLIARIRELESQVAVLTEQLAQAQAEARRSRRRPEYR